MPRPRILHIASLLDPYGASRQLRLLFEGLQQEGWENRVIALRTVGDTHQAISALGVPVARLQQRWKADPIALGRLAYALRKAEADLIHCWDLPASAYTHAVRLAQTPKRVVATLNHVQLNTRTRRLSIRQMARHVDRLVVSNSTSFQACVGAGVDHDKLRVISSGVARAEHPTCPRKKLLEELNVPEETKFIAVIGPLVAHKRVDDAIWCFELVRVLYDNARLLIVGDGPERRRLERFARLVSQPGAVRFLGLRKDVADILPHVDVLWQRSDWSEDQLMGDPHVLLEAMAVGVPVVATDIEPHREYIEHGRTGFLSQIGGRADCTRYTDQLFSDAHLACRIGQAGQKLVRDQFSLERMVQAYEQLYEIG